MDHPLQPEAASVQCIRIQLTPGNDPFAHLEAVPAAADCIPPAEAQRLMALCRDQGDDALTPAQHDAIWDYLLASPASQAWLAEQLHAIQNELREDDSAP